MEKREWPQLCGHSKGEKNSEDTVQIYVNLCLQWLYIFQ